MATYEMMLEQGVDGWEIKRKFAAFELLYGQSFILLSGYVQTKDGSKLLPADVSRGEVQKIGIVNLTVKLTSPEEVCLVPLDMLYTVANVPNHRKPRLLFMTKA